jgi:hypothetical protein
MSRAFAFQKALRCTATSKGTGARCKNPAMRGWRVCRHHGARGGAPCGEANGQYKHGLYTRRAVEERKALRELLRLAAALAKEV